MRNSTGDFKVKGTLTKLSVHCLIEPSKWTDTANAEALNAAHTLCEFYGFQEEKEQLRTELRVFHSSYTCSQKSAHVILETFKEFDAHIVFPTLFKLLKIFATLPVSTATVERSFSKVKFVKIKLCNVCGQEQLSDLLLLAIEKDIPIIKDEVIKIFQDIVPNKKGFAVKGTGKYQNVKQ